MSDSSMRVETVAAPVRQQVSSVLRTAIMSGRFQPGQRLIERDLCELIGVSRPSVREALRQLEAEGLVNSVPNRGPVVARVSRADAASIYEVRGVLEALAAKLFAERATEAQIAELGRTASALGAACRSGNVDRIIETKARFYQVLFQGSGNNVIPQMVRTMNDRVNLLRRTSLSVPERLPESIREIRVIVEAIKRRDGEKAFTASLAHVKAAADAALPLLEA
jgi:DNA-binding GntR family transcriptional regulator